MPPPTKKKRVVLMTQRTTAFLRRCGWLVGSTERFVQRPGGFGFRVDLFGWIDLLALKEETRVGPCCIGIQACAMSGRGAHLKKIRQPEFLEDLRLWLTIPGHRAELWAWRKLKVKRGGKAVRWTHEVTDLSKLLRRNP